MKYCICTIIKNEQHYLEEWIIHNLSIGFDAIYLYEDYGSDSHKSITDKYNKVFLHSYDEVEITDYSERDKKQIDLFNHFVKHYKEEYDWCAFIDPDEFIRFESCYSLERLCNEFKDLNGVMLQQKTYEANGHIERPEGGLQENYGIGNPYEYKCPKTCMKTIVNLHKYILFKGNHRVQGALFTNRTGRLSQTHVYQKAWYDHYYTKSWQDWIERFTKRGDVVPGNVKIGRFFEYNKELEEVLTPQLPLVFDVGCNNGDDTELYLKHGCRVVGVECSPSLCDKLKTRFNTPRFALETRCISDKDNDEISFFLSKCNVWNSCNKDIAEREHESDEIKVKTITLQSLFEQNELPKYCKIDIEGNDIIALNSITTLPQYISCETECTGIDGECDPFLILDKLHSLGYTKFKLINQRNNEVITSINREICKPCMPWQLPLEWDDYNDIRETLSKERNSHEFKTKYDFYATR